MNRRFAIALALGLLGCLVLLGAALAMVDLPTIDWWVFGSGGAPSSGGTVEMDDTLGQPVIGPSSGGDVALQAGYWYEAALLPELGVTKTADPDSAKPGYEGAKKTGLKCKDRHRARAKGAWKDTWTIE